jgi:hypothetical protein
MSESFNRVDNLRWAKGLSLNMNADSSDYFIANSQVKVTWKVQTGL